LRRSLAAVLPSGGKRLTVVCPSIDAQFEGESPELTIDDAVALAYILRAAASLGHEAEIATSTDLTGAVPGIVCVGGPDVNAVTAFLLANYCPGFQREGERVEGGWKATYSVGDQTFYTDPDKSIWALVRLPGAVTGREDDSLLVWGEFGTDTAAAAKHVLFKSRELAHSLRRHDGAMFIVAPRDRRLGHRFISQNIVDVTAAALGSGV
jgi:hypothetical protein